MDTKHNFIHIFQHELSYWFRHIPLYIYAVLLLSIATASMWGMAAEANIESGKMLNAPLQLHTMLGYFQKLLLFLVPAVVGLSVYRDYSSNMFTLLYAYPISRAAYYLGKFASGTLVIIAIGSTLLLGLWLGTQLPGVKAEVLLPLNIRAYLQSFLLSLLPTILIFSMLVFAVVALTRNIYAGFISVLAFLLGQGVMNALLGAPSSQLTAALLDPFGQQAIQYTTRYWSVREQNQNLLPLSNAIFYNRLLWLGIAAIAWGMGLYQFRLSQYSTFLRNSKPKVNGFQPTQQRILQIHWPQVRYQFGLKQQILVLYQLASFQLSNILRSRLFLILLIGGILLVALIQAQANPPYGFRTLPTTALMLRIPTVVFLGFIHLITFLYAGLLTYRARRFGFFELEDSSPLPTWIFPGSKLLALALLQVILLSIIWIVGMSIQLYQGYDHLQFGLYLFELYLLHLPTLLIWACLALLVQGLIRSPYPGFFLLLLIDLSVSGLPELGIHSFLLRFNDAPAYTYSEMAGYGSSLLPYFLYKTYWALFAGLLMVSTIGLWQRGLSFSFSERVSILVQRFQGSLGIPGLSLLILFTCLGFSLYLQENHPDNLNGSDLEEAAWMAEHERRYKRFEDLPQPEISIVFLEIDLFPDERSFQSSGYYQLVNRSSASIDTLLLHASYKEQTTYELSYPHHRLIHDSLYRVDIFLLEKPLLPGDSLQLDFTVNSAPNTLLYDNGRVKYNGTFLMDHLFPGIGYRKAEIENNQQRTKYGLPPKEPVTTFDSTDLQHPYSSRDADRIRLEAIISVPEGQTGIAAGELQQQWVSKGRRYFHYKMNKPVKKLYGINAGKFAVCQDKWKGVRLEIYYHPAHHHNLEHMTNGMKAALAYNSRHFSSYPHQSARIIEFPVTYSSHATTFATSIPFSEARFLAAVDTADSSAINMPFYIAAHEMAHQWWGNQLLPAEAPGARMLTESLAEYSALRALESKYGKAPLRRFLRLNRDRYLAGRHHLSRPEVPLIYVQPEQEYLSYRKGALAMYALSEQLGEVYFNRILKTFLTRFNPDVPRGSFLLSCGLMVDSLKPNPDGNSKFPPGEQLLSPRGNFPRLPKPLAKACPLPCGLSSKKYRPGSRQHPTSIDFLHHLKAHTPDSLQYLLTDWLETITLYDNRLVSVDIQPLNGKQFLVTADLSITKYRSDGQGERIYRTENGKSLEAGTISGDTLRSLPLADYLELGFYDETGELIKKEQWKATEIQQLLKVVLPQQPMRVVLDSRQLLLDARLEDNDWHRGLMRE